MQPGNPIDSFPDDDDNRSEIDLSKTGPSKTGSEIDLSKTGSSPELGHQPQTGQSDSPLNPYSPALNPSSSPLGLPRWWTPIAVAAVSLIVFIFASTVMAVIALVVVHGKLDMALLVDTDSFIAVSESRIGLFLLVVLPQIALVVPAVVAAFLSPVETRKRLSLVRGRWPVWAWIGAALATPLVGLISSILVGLVLQESENLKQMTEIFRDHGKSGFLLPLAMMIGMTPAICEEVLFRGYVQTRLTRSLGPIAGIFIASLLFAVFHIDPVHVIAVFPLGFFLGLVVWRSGSLFPAMIGHFINNAISVVAVVLPQSEENTNVLEAPSALFSLAIIFFGIMGVVSVAIAWSRFGSPETDELTAEVVSPQESNVPFA